MHAIQAANVKKWVGTHPLRGCRSPGTLARCVLYTDTRRSSPLTALQEGAGNTLGWLTVRCRPRFLRCRSADHRRGCSRRPTRGKRSIHKHAARVAHTPAPTLEPRAPDLHHVPSQQMCLQLREALSIGKIHFSDEFFSTTASVREVKEQLEGELRNFCVLVEAAK